MAARAMAGDLRWSYCIARYSFVLLKCIADQTIGDGEAQSAAWTKLMQLNGIAVTGRAGHRAVSRWYFFAS